MESNKRSKRRILAYRVVGMCCLLYPFTVLLILLGLLFGVFFVFPTITMLYEIEIPKINLLDLPFLIMMLCAGISIVIYAGFERSSYYEDWNKWLGDTIEDEALYDLVKYTKRLKRCSNGSQIFGMVFLFLAIWNFVLRPPPDLIWFVVLVALAVLIAGIFVGIGIMYQHESEYHAEASFKKARKEAKIE